jgi:hypothetical protein
MNMKLGRRLILLQLIIIIFHCQQWYNKNIKRENPEKDRSDIIAALGLIKLGTDDYKKRRVQSCSVPNAIDFGDSFCISDKVNRLILDSNSNQNISAAISQGVRSLECRCNVSSFLGGSPKIEWYIANSQPVTQLSNLNLMVTYSDSGTDKFYKFSNYKRGDFLLCRVDCDTAAAPPDKAYQTLQIQ